MRRRRDHPRVCGEHYASQARKWAFMGSSPRMRGAHKSVILPVQPTRIIPAYAGSTRSSWRHRRQAEDHPRVCGEHVLEAHVDGVRLGSSPRMRGALQTKIEDLQIGRIIPAYAGSTQPGHQDTGHHEDHPRVCGEHGCGRLRVRHHRGSSPRMRGAPIPYGYDVLPSRIIPAYAGSTDNLSAIAQRFGDHPRVCGEHYLMAARSALTCGSSPRMRGARNQRRGRTMKDRIIPAYAGSTAGWRSACPGPPDHPRVCGEHTSHQNGGNASPGSSPRMRGAPPEINANMMVKGIIPAYAGSTCCHA